MIDIKTLTEDYGGNPILFYSRGHVDKGDFREAILEEYNYLWDWNHNSEIIPVEQIKYGYARVVPLGNTEEDFPKGAITLKIEKDSTPRQGKFAVTYYDRG